MITKSRDTVLVVVLNYLGYEDTINAVKSLLTQSYPHFSILVVDNGTEHASSTRLSGFLNTLESEKILLKRSPLNLGFAGGVNLGITYGLEHAFDYIALFNNDAIAKKDWLESLIRSAHKTNSAITTGLLLNSSGARIDSTGEFYSIWGMSFPRSRGLDVSKAPSSDFVFGATGGASLYKASLFRQIGLFDKTFFAYYEDTDISFRAHLAGHKVYYTKDAIAHHQQGATSSKIPGFTAYQTFKNLPLLFWKNVPTKLLHKVGPRFLLLYVLIFGNALKKGSGWPALKGVLASIWYFWTSALWKRFKIQHHKQVSARYIWSILYHDLPPEQTGMRKFRKLFTGED